MKEPCAKCKCEMDAGKDPHAMLAATIHNPPSELPARFKARVDSVFVCLDCLEEMTDGPLAMLFKERAVRESRSEEKKRAAKE